MLNIKGTGTFPEHQICKGKWHKLHSLRKIVQHFIIYKYFVLKLKYLLLKHLFMDQ